MLTIPRSAIASSLVLALVVACSGSSGGFTTDGGAPLPLGDSGPPVLDTGTPSQDTGVPPTQDTGTPTGDTGTPTSEASPGQCTPNCKADSDCASTCPAVSGALNCCDTSSGVCFTSSEAQCPDQTPTMPEGGPDVCGGT